MDQIIDYSKTGDPVIWFVCGSHRAREKLIGRGSKVQGYHLAFSGRDINHRGIYALPVGEEIRALKIKGVRRLSTSRVPLLRPCWNF